MSTIGRRGATWTNSDSLVVGFGTNKSPREGSTHQNAAGTLGGVKVASVKFDYVDMNACNGAGGTVNVPVPAGARIVNVRIVCDTAWTSTGTNTAQVGLTGGDTDLFITTTVLTTASFTAGAVLNGDGVGLFGATDAGASELYQFAAADTIDLLSDHADWLTGTATLFVTYI